MKLVVDNLSLLDTVLNCVLIRAERAVDLNDSLSMSHIFIEPHASTLHFRQKRLLIKIVL